MKHQEIQAQVDAFLAAGGSVTSIKEGVSSIDPTLKHCRCGCRGDYTEHSMRAGESGRCSSTIIR